MKQVRHILYHADRHKNVDMADVFLYNNEIVKVSLISIILCMSEHTKNQFLSVDI